MNKLQYIFLSLIIGFSAQAMEQPKKQLLNFKGQLLVNEQLLAAVRSHDIELVKTLIAYGADVNYMNQDGFNPLRCAIVYDDLAIFKELLNAGANLNFKAPYDVTALNSVPLSSPNCYAFCEIIVAGRMKILSDEQRAKIKLLWLAMKRSGFDTGLRSCFKPFLQSAIEQENKENPRKARAFWDIRNERWLGAENEKLRLFLFKKFWPDRWSLGLDRDCTIL